ncbi:MAG: hypothetical protein MPJ24_05815 [Pirellulaceae bacterium]|nr:hypothetical protein [Pirellulaceae bacterium]
MTFLVYLEMPLASSLTVIFLGKDIFLEKHSLNGILSELWEGLGRLLYSHLVWRFLFLGLSITYFLRISIVSPETISNDVGTWIGWVFLFFFVAWILRLFRPFINEVILLEKLPARNQEDKGRTLAKRSSSLHNANLGTLLLQGIYSFFLAIFLSWALISGLTFLRGILFANWYWDDLTLNFLYPGVLWVVGLYFTVWRFLCYLNIRIRDEGWEIELLMRAEATRLRERRFGFKSH